MLESAPSIDAPDSAIAHLRLADRIVTAIGRRNLLAGADLEDFGSWVRTRLVADDYAVFRKFGGRSSIETYLTVVLTRMFIDYRNEQWGRWRPSAAAVRLGPMAVRLERMIYRDGSPVREAIEALRSSAPEVPPAELKRVLAAIPPRHATKSVGLESADTVPAQDPDDFWSREESDNRRVTEVVLRKLVDSLPPEDRLIIQMRYWQGASVADIARALRVDQKPLYRRIERIQVRLHHDLEKSGISRERVTAMFDNGEAA